MARQDMQPTLDRKANKPPLKVKDYCIAAVKDSTLLLGIIRRIPSTKKPSRRAGGRAGIWAGKPGKPGGPGGRPA